MINKEKILKAKLDEIIGDWFAKVLWEHSVGCYETGGGKLRNEILELLKNEKEIKEERKEK